MSSSGTSKMDAIVLKMNLLTFVGNFGYSYRYLRADIPSSNFAKKIKRILLK